MDMSRLPKVFSSVIGLGGAVGFYPTRRSNRWTKLILALVFLAATGGVLLYAAYVAYMQWLRYGPAVIGQYLTWPALIAFGLFLLGAILAWSACVNWNKAGVVYQNGFAYNDHRGLQVWRWQEVASTRAAVARRYINGIYIGTTRVYTLEQVNGARLVLNDAIARVEELVGVIEQRTFPLLYERAAQGYNAGQVLVFGPVTLSKAGIQIGKKNYPWDEVERVSIRQGFFQISRKDGGWFSNINIAISAVPNLRVMLSIVDQVVGVKVQE